MSWIDKVAVKIILETDKTTHDNLIDKLIPFVEQRFKTLSSYDPETGVRTERVKVIDARQISLHWYPITAVTHIKIFNGAVCQTLVASDYEIRPGGGIEFDSMVTGTVEAKYTAGYEVASIPSDIINGIIMQVIDWVNKTGRLGLKSIGKAGEGTTYEDLPLLPSFIKLCESYKNPIPDRSVI